MRVNNVLLLLFFIPLQFIFSVDLDPDGKQIKEGVDRYNQKDFQGALENFSNAEKSIGDDSRVYFNKGTSYYKLNDYKNAQKYFEKSAESDSKELKLNSYYNLGNTYSKLGDKKNAIRSYMQSLSIDPNFSKARKNLELLNQEKEDKKDKQDQDKKDENKKENEDKQNKESNSDNKKLNKPNQNEKEDKSNTKNKELTKEEAEKILESMQKDKINRKKTGTGYRDKDEIFW